MKRNQRIALISRLLTSSPGTQISLEEICSRFSISKSTASEDMNIVRSAFEEAGDGFLECRKGPGGGFRYIPGMNDSSSLQALKEICSLLQDPGRILGGGFIYTSDIMFHPVHTATLAHIFAQQFRDKGADYIVTIETKGIPLAVMTARLLNIPSVVVRREHKVSEGPTISINYFSSASDRMKKMSISKLGIRPGSKAIIIDDFMRAGGSIKGILELLNELDIEVLAKGVAITSETPAVKKISDCLPLMYLGNVDEKNRIVSVYPNPDLFPEN